MKAGGGPTSWPSLFFVIFWTRKHPVGAAVQMPAPFGSSLHRVQPSPETVLPSSHSSLADACRMPSPQPHSVHTASFQGGTWQDRPAPHTLPEH